MEGTEIQITDLDRKLAALCLACPVCSYARRKQRGLIFWFVLKVEGRICPNGKAYSKVYGRKSHEPIPAVESPAETGS
ncbi:MAG: hypothetical protein V1794_04035 [Candidatus Glassbacteria bacterium]